MNRSKIKHLLRLGCWNKRLHSDLTLKFFYMCGQKVLTIKDNKDDLMKSIKEVDIKNYYPKIIFYPKSSYNENNAYINDENDAYNQNDENNNNII